MAGETSSILAILVFAVFAVDVFLYYRWKGLQEEHSEKKSKERIGSVKEHVTNFSTGFKETGGEEVVVYSAEPAEAEYSTDELKSIIDEQVVPLHQKMIEVDGKLS
ncbi:MAG: hypothetical protein V1717_03425 [Candidatus Micrarchaeota archaeon]